MVSITTRRRIIALHSAIIGLFLATSPFALCFNIDSSSGLPIQHSPYDGQTVLQGLDVESSASSDSSTTNVVQIPLQRRFIQYNGRFYFVQANVGSPGQSLELIMDTGSTDTWVYSSDYCSDQSSNNPYQCCTSLCNKILDFLLTGFPYLSRRPNEVEDLKRHTSSAGIRSQVPA